MSYNGIINIAKELKELLPYNSIHHSETTVNSLEKINLTDKLSKIVLTHIITILVSIFSIGYRGKTVDFETHSNCHHTTIAHFLNNGKWDESILENVIKQCVIKTVYNNSIQMILFYYVLVSSIFMVKLLLEPV